MDWDVRVYHAFNQVAGQVPVLDWLFSRIAEYSLEMYAVLFIIAWFALPKHEVDKRHGLLLAGVAGVIGLLLNFVISHIWYRPRPFVTLPEGSYTKLIPHDPDASFPSDHTSGSFGFAFGAAGRTSRWVSRTFLLLAVLVMVSRVYCGVHYPTDVLASVVVGFVSSRISWKLSGVLLPLTRRVCRLFGYGK